MRIADTMVFDQTRENLGKNRSKMADLQNKAATQKRVTKPSDDPVAAARVLKTRVDISGQDQYLKSVNYAKSFLEYSDQSLNELTDLLVRAKELSLGQASDASSNAQSRKVVGTEIQQILHQSVSVANRKLGDRFIFGGHLTTKAPFGPDGSYRGNSGEMRIHVDKDTFIPMNLPGNGVFLGEGVGLGAEVKENPQPRTIEEFLAKKEKSAGNETSEELEYGNDERQIKLRGPASLRTPNVEAKESVETEEQAKDRLPQGTADYSNSLEGKNLFHVLKNLETSLMANDKFGIQEAIEELDDSIEQVVLSRAKAGARINSLDKISESHRTSRVDNKNFASTLEDADIYDLVSDITKTESSLQATLNTSGKILQPSLLDFLR